MTPDSFSDGGQFNHPERALNQVNTMIAQGASLIDIGGESTRPQSMPVCESEQIARVVPIIEMIRKHSAIPISIDTTRSAVARAALEAGANIINDVSAGIDDPTMFSLAAQKKVPIVLMHAQGTPQTMQNNPHYNHVVKEVLDALTVRIHAALEQGIMRENIILDVGIGFGKRRQDNLALLSHLADFVALGFPVLLGTSRKRFMGAICDIADPKELVSATAATTALGVMAGVQLFRVHDVKENKQALDVALAIRNAAV